MTHELDLDILPLDLHAKIQVSMSVRSAVRVLTHRRTDIQCQNYYTRHITDVGCKDSCIYMNTCDEHQEGLLSLSQNTSVHFQGSKWVFMKNSEKCVAGRRASPARRARWFKPAGGWRAALGPHWVPRAEPLVGDHGAKPPEAA